MAVALATLPLKSALAGDGETFLVTAAGGETALAPDLPADFTTGAVADLFTRTGAATGFATCFGADLGGTTAFFATGLAGALPAAFATGLPLALAFPTTIFFAAIFLTATFFATTFLAAAFPAARLATGLAFFACGFAETLATADLPAGFFAATGLAAAFFTEAFFTGFTGALATGLVTLRPALAGVLLALFTVRPFVAAAFDLPAAFASCDLVGAFPFCALAAVALRVVFAISLTIFGPGGRVL